MSTSLGFIIRDGLETDIETCLGLDHRYESDFVWQMNVEESPGEWRIRFATQRLPRTLETTYPAHESHLRLALPPEQCFLVAAAKDTGETLGYLTLRPEPAHRTAWLQNVVVSMPYRRRRIGTRLVNVARQWAKERDLDQIMAEQRTQNYPGIAFCQALGFKFCGYNDHYFPNLDIAVFFSQTLR
jgi:ribosomal protein S18 acetylase RimI-like enzyme